MTGDTFTASGPQHYLQDFYSISSCACRGDNDGYAGIGVGLCEAEAGIGVILGPLSALWWCSCRGALP